MEDKLHVLKAVPILASLGEELMKSLAEGAEFVAVKKGDLLVRIKPDIYQSQVDQQEANLVAARASSVQAKAQLLEVINRINAQTQEMFIETFNKIRDNFQVMFTEIFDGGKADLQLVDAGDVLESGGQRQLAADLGLIFFEFG